MVHLSKIRSTPTTQLYVELLEERRVLTLVVPALESFPGAEHTAFLDFDGHNVTGTTWNANFETIHSPAFDMDGDPSTFSQQELERIELIWGQMAEDFRPFNINITTVDPSIANPGIFAEPDRAQRVLFTSVFDSGPGGTGERWVNRAIPQGFAALRSWFDDSANPVFVFTTHALSGTIGSHELGHAVGLNHDGELLPGGGEIEYRGAHGTGETRWSPIMGAGSAQLTQWSRGEYGNASNRENDISMLSFALGKRPDDYPATIPVVFSDLGDGLQTYETSGIIETWIDDDIFLFELNETSFVTVDVTPWELGANLDIGVSLWGLGNFLVPLTDTSANPVDSLSAGFQMELEPGTYYLTVTGEGKQAVPGDEGYPEYGSLGYYELNIELDAEEVLGDVNGDGFANSQDIDTLYALLSSSEVDPIPVGNTPASIRADLNQDRFLNQLDVNVLLHEILVVQPGDFDLNGRVEFLDFLVLSENFGSNASTWSSGDTNGDGRTDFADFLVLSQNFGFVTGDDE